MKKLTLFAIATAFIFVACKTTKHSETASTATATNTVNAVSYKTDVQSIIETKCVRCHGEDGKGGYNFTTIDDVIRAGKKGKLLGTIKWQEGYHKMPARGEQLDAASIAKIENWVNSGMNK